MRDWHRLFFINSRRLRNFIAAGAIDPDSPAIRLVGMPKVDCLVDGTCSRAAIVRTLGLDPARPTVLYAPTWSPASSLNAMGWTWSRAAPAADQRDREAARPFARSAPKRYSGGVDWVAALGRSSGSAGNDRAGPRHLPVPRRGGPHDHGPQLRRIRISAAAIARSCASTGPSCCNWPTSIPTTRICSDRWPSRRTRSSRRWQPSRKGSPIHAPSAPRGGRSPRTSSTGRAGHSADRGAAYEAMALDGVPDGVTAQEAPCHS